MSWNFNPAAHDPSVGFQRQEEGDYTVVIKKTNLYLNQEKTNFEGIALECQVLDSLTKDGPNIFAGKTVEIELAVLSQSEQRQQIANSDLSAICIVAGIGAFDGQFGADGQPIKDMFAPAMHDKPFKVSMIHTEKKQDDGSVKTYSNWRYFRNMSELDANGGQSVTWAKTAKTAHGATTPAAQQPAQGAQGGWTAPAQAQAPAASNPAPAQAQPQPQPQQAAPAVTNPANVPVPGQGVAPAQPAQAQPAQQGAAPSWGGGAPAGGAPSWGGTG